MEITFIEPGAHAGDTAIFKGVELTATGREKTLDGQLVSRRVVVAEGDYTILTEPASKLVEYTPGGDVPRKSLNNDHLSAESTVVAEVSKPTAKVRPTWIFASPAQLAELAAQRHYANACSDDPERSFYNSPAYLGSRLALRQAIAAAYPEVDVLKVEELFTDTTESIAWCVERAVQDEMYERRTGNELAIEGAAWELLMASPVLGPSPLVTQFFLHCEGGVYVDRTLATASWWDRYELTPGIYPFIPTRIDGTPCGPDETPYYFMTEINAILRESYRVNRLFTESSSQTAFPDTATVVRPRLYAHEVTDGRVLSNYGTYTHVRQFTRKAGI
jgi:hypothetical protein